MKNIKITMERKKFIVNGELKNDTIDINFPTELYNINGMFYSYQGIYRLAIKTEELQKIITDLVSAYFELINNTNKK